MALVTLKGFTKIGFIDIGRVSDAETQEELKESLKKFIIINDETNTIAFKIQNGPIKEVGVNGCQIDDVIEAAKLIIEGLNKEFPCRENACAITKLDEALMWLDKRKKDREKRNVEGKNQL